MNLIRKLAVIMAVFLPPIVASATPITIGSLSSNDDGSTEVITDSLNGLEWLRRDVLADLTYSQTLAAISSQELMKDGA